jgi:hypothetical protein
VHDSVGTPEPTSADDHVLKTGVADHHSGDRPWGLGKIALDATESAGVLIDVKQQRHRAGQPAALPGQTGQ